MEIVVGVTPDPQSHDALALGAALARTLRAELVLVNVYPVAYNYASTANVDAEWHRYLKEEANETLDEFREALASDHPDLEGVTFLIHGHRSSGVGLIEVAEQRDSSMIVIGSAPGGSSGRINGGSTSDQLLHGSPVPVAIAPQDYRRSARDSLARAVLAYQRTPESEHCLDVTIASFNRRGLSSAIEVNLLTVVERVTRFARSRLGSNAESQVLAALREEARAAHEIASAKVAAAGIRVSAAVVEGDSVLAALSKFDWYSDDIFVVGSTDRGAIRRVLLGDMTYKLLRAATVPVVVIPRGSEVPSADS
ncbi:MAG: universal stress protein [Actinomycetes bacterium]